MPTINKRIEELENKAPTKSEHHYEMFIHWEEEAEYFRDGEPISRSEFMAEVPTDEIIVSVDWENHDENNKQAN